jgi:hypothetical protein
MLEAGFKLAIPVLELPKTACTLLYFEATEIGSFNNYLNSTVS